MTTVLSKKKKSAFYPGAGLDVFPPIMYRDIEFFIYMDSQPLSEFGNTIFDGAQRPKFIQILIKIMDQNNFKLILIEDNNLTFFNSEYNQTILYETNSVFPQDLQQRHYDCNTLILCGFDTAEQTIDLINRFDNIITNNITCHELDDEPLFLSKNVSTMIINNDWIYWSSDNLFTDVILQNIKIEPRFITHLKL